MRILVFGASGFIGSSLVSYLSGLGHEVIALCRSNSIPGFDGICLTWKLGDQPPPDLGRVDCAIHLAHDFDGNAGADRTIFGTKLAVDECANIGIIRQIFFSSYSSGEHAVSLYGKTKFRLERILSSVDGVMVVRPGLVLGDGGIYGRIKKFAQSFPVIPYPSGDGRVPIIELDRLCLEISLIATGDCGRGPFNLFEKKLFNLRDLINRATTKNFSKPLLLPIPIAIVRLTLYICSILNITLPINKDNLDGFLANKMAPHTSTLDKDK